MRTESKEHAFTEEEWSQVMKHVSEADHTKPAPEQFKEPKRWERELQRNLVQCMPKQGKEDWMPKYFAQTLMCPNCGTETNPVEPITLRCENGHNLFVLEKSEDYRVPHYRLTAAEKYFNAQLTPPLLQHEKD